VLPASANNSASSGPTSESSSNSSFSNMTRWMLTTCFRWDRKKSTSTPASNVGSDASPKAPERPSGRRSLVRGRRIPGALDPEQDGRVGADRDGVRRRDQLLDELGVGLLVTLEIERLLAFGDLESEEDPPQPRVYRLGVGNDLVVALARAVIEHEMRVGLQDMAVAIFLAERGALKLGEVLEPPDAQGADRLVAGVHDHMGGLVVVAVEALLRLDTMLLHEADAADGVGVQHLLVSRDDFAADLIVVRRDGPHLIFHNLPPPLRQVVGSRANRSADRKRANRGAFNASVELPGCVRGGVRPTDSSGYAS